jgi:OmpA-OmpF porin, OOP family
LPLGAAASPPDEPPSVPVLRLAQVPGMRILEPYQTVDREHQDRKARLARLSRLDGIDPPEIDESYIPQYQHGLKDYPVDIPVARVVFRDNVFFDSGSTELKPEADAVLDIIAGSLSRDPPDVTLFVAGHTDSQGPWDYNLDLGLKRARAVVSALIVKKGLGHARLFVVSFGKAVPLASNDTEAGRARNRRVEFLFAAQPEPIAAWLAQQKVGACLPSRTGDVEACPTDYTFTATQVRLRRPVPAINGGVPQPPPASEPAATPQRPAEPAPPPAAQTRPVEAAVTPQRPPEPEPPAPPPPAPVAHARTGGTAVAPQPSEEPAAPVGPSVHTGGGGAVVPPAQPPAAARQPPQAPARPATPPKPPAQAGAPGKPGSEAHAQTDPLVDSRKVEIDLKSKVFEIRPPE